MTQITTTTQPGDIVVIVPRWIIRAVGFLSLFVGLSASFMLFLVGYITEGVLLAVIMLALVPIALLIQYVVWRFYWYLILIGLIFQSLCYGLSVIGIAGRMPLSNSPFASTASIMSRVSPVSGLLALLLAAFITASLWRVYSLWQGGAGAKPKPPQPVGDAFDFDAPATTLTDTSLMGRVLKKLEATGSRGEIKGDTIYVYKGSQFVGIVRVIDRQAAISPVILNDVIKQRDRLGAKVAYLATSGMFTSQVRDLADQQGLKLMTV